MPIKRTIGKSLQVQPDLYAIERLLAARGVTGVTPEEAAERYVQYIASEESVDTTGDLILASGWDVGDWLQNASLFADHRKLMELKVGYGLDANVVGKQLIVDAFFLPPSVAPSPLVEGVWKMVKAGVNPDCSVGFWPKADGWRPPTAAEKAAWGPELYGVFQAQWLKELSPCGVGAHPAAKVEAVAKHLDAKLWNEDEIRAFAGVEDLAPLFERAFFRQKGPTTMVQVPAVPAVAPEIASALKSIGEQVAALAATQKANQKATQMRSKDLGVFLGLDEAQVLAGHLEAALDILSSHIPDPDDDGSPAPAPEPPYQEPTGGSPAPDDSLESLSRSLLNVLNAEGK
jgi:hypothetical protein